MGKKLIPLLLALVLGLHAQGRNLWDDNSYYVRLGYNVGGTAPVGMPATIRSLSKYTLKPNLLIGFDIHKSLGNDWGLLVGLHIENKDMETDARVKNYHMAMRQGGQSLRGVYTGNVTTEVTLGMVTVPVLATYDVSPKVRLKCGPYVSFVYNSEFSGYAHGGYLRVNDPTGNKVDIGSDSGTRGTYDFSDDLRNLQVGFDLGADWYFSNRWGASLDLAWGVNGIFKRDFEVIDDTLFPIYGTIGVIYKIK